MDRSGRGGHLAAAPSDAGGRWALDLSVVVRTRLNNYLSLPRKMGPRPSQSPPPTCLSLIGRAWAPRTEVVPVPPRVWPALTSITCFGRACLSE